jgi:hypothetical protein
MRSPPLAFALLFVLAGCARQNTEPAFPPGHLNPIVVDEFAVGARDVTLDPTLGYSLERGLPGVPHEERAAAIGRAAAFTLAAALSRELTRDGYDVVAGEDAALAPAQRALIVSGDFQHINEGIRHEGASVEVGVAVDYQGGSTGAQRLTAFALDSRRLPRDGPVAVAGRHGEDVNYEATRLGAAIGRYVAELARSNRWPGR